MGNVLVVVFIVMINLTEQVANAIEQAAYESEHLDQEYPMKAEAIAAINFITDIIEKRLFMPKIVSEDQYIPHRHTEFIAEQLRNFDK